MRRWQFAALVEDPRQFFRLALRQRLHAPRQDAEEGWLDLIGRNPVHRPKIRPAGLAAYAPHDPAHKPVASRAKGQDRFLALARLLRA